MQHPVRLLATTLAYAVVTVLGTACHAPMGSTHNVTEAHELIETHSYSADLRAVHLIKRGDKFWIMAEPPPDSAISNQSDFDLHLALMSFGGGSSKDSDKSQSGSENSGLEGRTPSVVLAREMLYRLNEMAHNSNMTAAQYQASFDKIVAAISTIAVEEMQHSAFTEGFQSAITTTLEGKLGLSDTSSETDNKSDTKSDTRSDTTTDSNTRSDSRSESDTKTDSKSKTDSNSKTENDSNTKTDSNSKTESDSSTKTDDGKSGETSGDDDDADG